MHSLGEWKSVDVVKYMPFTNLLKKKTCKRPKHYRPRHCAIDDLMDTYISYAVCVIIIKRN